MQLKFFVFFLSVIVIADASSVKQILNDFDDAETQASKLENSVDALPTQGTSLGVLDVLAQMTITKSLIDRTSVDGLTLNTVSEPDGESLFQAATALSLSILAFLQGIVAKKPVFVALGLCEAVQVNLEGLKDSTDTLGDALIPKTPASVQTQANQLRGVFNDAFDAAIADYNCTF